MRQSFIFIFVCFVLIGCQKQGTLLDIQEIHTPAGIQAWLVEDHSVPVISLQFGFKGVGSALDPHDKQGRAQLVSNTMDEGAGDLEAHDFQKTLRDFSINLDFYASRDSFGGSVKTLSKYQEKAFELLALAIQKPRFDAAPLERMRKANQSRIRTSLSNPDWIAARILNDIAYQGHPYAQNSGGTLRTLEAITADDLRAFTQFFSKDRLVVAASGDITKETLSAALDRVFGLLPEVTNIPDIPDTPLQNQGETFIHSKNIPQTLVRILQPGLDRADPDYQTGQVMNFILGSSGFGSRLMEEIREKRGLTYGIYSSFQGMDHINTLSVHTSTENQNAAKMLSLIATEWDKMRTQPVTQQELDDAKSYLIGSLPLSLTSTDKISSLLLSLQLDDLPIDYLEQRETAIRKTSIRDIQSVAMRLLDTSQFLTLLVGQPNVDDGFQTIEDIPNAE